MKNKNLLQLALALAVGTFLLNASAEAACPLKQDAPPPPTQGKMAPPPPPEFKKMSPADKEKWKQEHEKRKAEFDARLKLTDAQKKQIEQNRIDSKKKMQPLWEEKKAKKLKIQEIMASTLSQEEKDKQICALKEEMKTIKAQMRQLREENMKAFEAILTDAQKKEFEKMKAEHKKKMDKKFKGQKPPFPPPCKK